jgi:hypothetical protein
LVGRYNHPVLRVALAIVNACEKRLLAMKAPAVKGECNTDALVLLQKEVTSELLMSTCGVITYVCVLVCLMGLGPGWHTHTQRMHVGMPETAP